MAQIIDFELYKNAREDEKIEIKKNNTVRRKI